MTVSQVTASTGKFYLTTAPGSSDSVYLSYNSSRRLVDPPHNLVKMACIYLTASMAYSKINVGKAPRFRDGPLLVFRDTTANKYWKDLYYDTIAKINSMVDTMEYSETI